MKNMKKISLLCVITLSFLVNIIFLVEEGYFYHNIRQYSEDESLLSEKTSNISDFQSCLMTGAKRTLYERIVRYVPAENNTLRDRINDLLGKKRVWDVNRQYDWSEAGYMMQAMWKTAEHYNDSNTMNYIKEAFDEFCLNREMVRVDQSVYATMAIYLYQRFKDEKYKKKADYAFNWLIQHNTEKYGILFFQDDTLHNHVDAVGVYNPFLIEYSKAFNCPKAYQLAVSCFEKWCKYGVEKELGRPVQVFNTTPPYEKGRPNWGRGFSWYTLGFCSIERDSFSLEISEMVEKYINYINYIYQRDKRFTQYVNSAKAQIDLSATLPLVWFLYSNHYIDLTEQEILDYSKYMRDNIMYFSSGIPFSRTIQTTSSQRLSQAFMLLIILEYQKRHQ